MIIDFKKELEKPEYNFLSENKHLGKNVCLIGLGGSYAYGTTVETSDVDIRGVAINTKEEILLGQDFEQVCNNVTDTTIYSFNKIIKLLTSCNPNVIELLGLKPEHYLYKNKIGELLVENRKLFLSKVAIQSFGGYATAQLRKLDNKAGRLGDEHIQIQYIANSMNNAKYAVQQLITRLKSGNHFDIFVNDDTLFTDIDLECYPLDDLLRLVTEVTNVKNDYKRLGSRNSKVIEHDKIGKHMMHLFRILSMGIEILEDEEINTYRQSDHDFLMSVRNNSMLDNKGQPTSEFWEVLSDLEKRFDYAKKNTSLPDVPNIAKINELKMLVNEMIINGSI